MDPYLGTILPFAGSYAPDGWHLCDGSLLPISDNQALYSLLGTIYGGDGVNTFGIPDLRGRIPVGAYMNGTSTGTNYALGTKGGLVSTQLTSANMPLHGHTATVTPATGTYKVSSTTGNNPSPANAKLGTSPSPNFPYITAAATVALGSAATGNFSVPVGTDGNNTQVVPSVPPYVGLTFIIATIGLYPQRAN